MLCQRYDLLELRVTMVIVLTILGVSKPPGRLVLSRLVRPSVCFSFNDRNLRCEDGTGKIVCACMSAVVFMLSGVSVCVCVWRESVLCKWECGADRLV